jgi:DNA replication and repair protein RecF
MQLKQLSLTNFRNFTRLDVDVPSGVVIILGSNAQGKTSLLEAVYYLATLTSLHAENDRQLVNFLAGREQLAVARLVGNYCRGENTHRLEIRLIQERNGINAAPRLRKEVLIDGVKRKNSEMIGQFNAVIFLPQMMRIVDGPPRERRRYLNLALAQVKPAYGPTLREYQKALTQRNALLKQLSERGGDPDQLAYWDEQLVGLGARLIFARIHAVQELENLATRIHQDLTRRVEVLRLDYRPAFDPLPRTPGQYILPLDAPPDRSGISVEEIEAGYLARLVELRREEIARGVTTVGPHRDELRFLSNGVDLGIYGSRGQIRTTLMTLKLAEVAWMHAKTGHWPVALLDEVLAELDQERREDLLKQVGACRQVMLTTTDLNPFEPAFVEDADLWKIHSGQLSRYPPEE